MTEPVESFAIRAAHAGRAPLPESLSRPLTPPIYQSTVYAFARLDDLDTLNPDAQSYTYYRYGTPTHAALLADATFASPAVLCPLAHGATLVWHSVAKFLGGHSAAMGGLAAGEAALVVAMREKIVRFGGCQGAMDAWLTLLGLPTLPLRMAAHSRTGQAGAEVLATHPAIEHVYYPGLPSHAQPTLARALYPAGCGGMLAFDLRGGEDAVRQLVARLRLVAFAPSLADVTTTITYPYATSHHGLPEDVLRALGVGTGLVRLSAGIEDPTDVIADLTQALAPLD